MPYIGWGEVLLIVLIILLLFGSKKLPDLARSLGLSVKEFKRGVEGPAEEKKTK